MEVELTRRQIRGLKRKQKDIRYQATGLNGNRAWARRIRQAEVIETKKLHRQMENNINNADI